MTADRLTALTFGGVQIVDGCSADAWRSSASLVAAANAGTWHPDAAWIDGGARCCTCSDCVAPDGAWPTDPTSAEPPPWDDQSDAATHAWGVWPVAWEATAPLVDTDGCTAGAWRLEVQLVGDTAGRAHLATWLATALHAGCTATACDRCADADLTVMLGCGTPATIRGARVVTFRELAEEATACTTTVEVLFEAATHRAWLPAVPVDVWTPADWSDVECSPLHPLIHPDGCDCGEGITWSSLAGAGCVIAPGDLDDSPLTRVLDSPDEVAWFDLAAAAGLSAPFDVVTVDQVSAGDIRVAPDGVTWRITEPLTPTYVAVVTVRDARGVECTIPLAMLHRPGNPYPATTGFDARLPVDRTGSESGWSSLPPHDTRAQIGGVDWAPHPRSASTWAGLHPPVAGLTSTLSTTVTCNAAAIWPGASATWYLFVGVADQQLQDGRVYVTKPPNARPDAWSYGTAGNVVYSSEDDGGWFFDVGTTGAGGPIAVGSGFNISITAQHDGSGDPLGGITASLGPITSTSSCPATSASSPPVPVDLASPPVSDHAAPIAASQVNVELHSFAAWIERGGSTLPPEVWHADVVNTTPQHIETNHGYNRWIRVHRPSSVASWTISATAFGAYTTVDSQSDQPLWTDIIATVGFAAGPSSIRVSVTDVIHDGSTNDLGDITVETWCVAPGEPIGSAVGLASDTAPGPRLIDSGEPRGWLSVGRSTFWQTIRRGELAVNPSVWSITVANMSGAPIENAMLRIKRPAHVTSWSLDWQAHGGASAEYTSLLWLGDDEYRLAVDIPGDPSAYITIDVTNVQHDGSPDSIGDLTAEMSGEFFGATTQTTIVTDSAPGPVIDPVWTHSQWWEDDTVRHATVVATPSDTDTVWDAWWTWPEARGPITVVASTGGHVDVMGAGIRWRGAWFLTVATGAAVALADSDGRYAVVVVAPASAAALDAVTGCDALPIRPPVPSWDDCDPWCEPVERRALTITLAGATLPWSPILRITATTAVTVGVWWWTDTDTCPPTPAACGALGPTRLELPAGSVGEIGPAGLTVTVGGETTSEPRTAALAELAPCTTECVQLSIDGGDTPPDTVELLTETWRVT